MSEFINCPHCAEEIKAEAKICKHCKSSVVWESVSITDSAILKKAKNIVLNSSTHWQVRDSESDSVSLVFNKEKEKASCGTSCCLMFILLPIGILYAILGWSKWEKGQVSINVVWDNLELDWDTEFLLKAYHTLKKSEVWSQLVENEAVKKAIKTKQTSNIIIAVCLILLFVLIIASA